MADSHQQPLRIAPLPADEVARICAGEVVERPLNVVKELVENSLDAGATAITIELYDGGKQLVRVSDDGGGIAFDDLPLAALPHHTSKIHGLDDIYALTTLGFRGEALHSIAAVSRLTLTSRPANERLGGRIVWHAGELIEHTRANLQPGTEVEVAELFFNTPARLKFLKSQQSETSQASALLAAYTLAYPQVRWRLTSQGRQLLAADGDGDLRGVLSGLVGREAGEKLAKIDFEFPPSAVSGYISSPQHHRHNRQRQWYFINNRPVSNRLLYKAVDDAVREFLSPGKFPMGVFFLDLPPEEIDVNVHPMKREVSFAQPQAVYSLLRTAVQRALGQAAAQRQHYLTRGLASIVKPESRPRRSASGDPGADPDAPPGYRALPLYAEGQAIPGPSTVEPPPPRDAPASEPHQRPAVPRLDVSVAGDTGQLESQSHSTDTLPAVADKLPSLVSQVGNSYLIAVLPDAIYLIDQHAAHERVLFEELYDRLADAQAPASQRLLFPLLVQLTPAEAELVEENIAALQGLGFSCELGAGPSLVVKDVPLALSGRITAELVHAVLGELAEQGAAQSLAERLKALAASLACRAAIKAGDRLPPDECYTLVQQLLSRRSSLSCPHGRPTLIRLGRDEFDHMFLR